MVEQHLRGTFRMKLKGIPFFCFFSDTGFWTPRSHARGRLIHIGPFAFGVVTLGGKEDW